MVLLCYDYQIKLFRNIYKWVCILNYMKTKRSAVFIIGLMLSLFLISVVSAQDSRGFVSGVEKFFKPILKGIFGESTDIFEQLLFALIILAFVYMALSRIEAIKDNVAVLWVISVAISILSVRYIATEGLIQTILLPQGVLGVALLVFIPFLIFFWFLEVGLDGTNNKIMRKIGWSVYAAVYIFLWFKQFYLVTTTKHSITLFGWLFEGTSTSASVGPGGYLYLLIAGIAIIVLLMDKTIQGAISKSRAETRTQATKVITEDKMRQKLHELHENYNKATTDSARKTYEDEIKRLEKKIKDYRKL